MTGRGDVLKPLAEFREHSLYPRAEQAVLNTLRRSGWAAAKNHAQEIAERMTDTVLLERLKSQGRGVKG